MIQTPAIIKLSERVLVDIENAVRGFARINRYSVGEELRTQARAVVRSAKRAWWEKRKQLAHLARLVEAIDNLKIELQLAQQLHAFRSFGEFEAVAKLVGELGRQCGGWRKEAITKSRNASNANPSVQRAPILSAQAASQEAQS
jgi:hypothetical protein